MMLERDSDTGCPTREVRITVRSHLNDVGCAPTPSAKITEVNVTVTA